MKPLDLYSYWTGVAVGGTIAYLLGKGWASGEGLLAVMVLVLVAMYLIGFILGRRHGA